MNRKVYHEEGHGHFITFSCYRKRKLLDTPQARGMVLYWLSRQLERAQAECSGFVIMPDHAHVILRFTGDYSPSTFMQQWKRLSSIKIKDFLEVNKKHYLDEILISDPIWQPHFYDFNLVSQKKLEEKLNYMHNNPVRAGLVDNPSDWGHSSARWYEQGKSVGVPLVTIA